MSALPSKPLKRAGPELRRELRNLSGSRLTANGAQLSIRDLRLRPLRAMPQLPGTTTFESPLEDALQQYLDSLE